ncbi:MAG: deoxyhypusine synthase [Candidatus Bathyarchaeia archaeon]
MDRHQVLRHPTRPIKIDPDKTVSELVSEMALTGFQGRKLGEAADAWTAMLKKREIVIWMGVAGAMVPAGMRELITYLIRRRMIDVLVTTGATLYHDAYESIGGKHFLGTDQIDNVMLRRHRIDRVYDVYADERKFYQLDVMIEKEFSSRLQPGRPYSSREVMHEFGKWVSEMAGGRDGICISAYESGVPIFVPAFCDSGMGFSLMFSNRRRKRHIIVDHMRDVDESSRITEKSRNTAVIIVGGGVPKNFIQQTAVIASYQTRHDRTHNFAIQFTTDVPQWGGLSGSTFEEAQSWGKYNARATMVQCFADATISLPVVVQALSQRYKRLRRRVPRFHWNHQRGALQVQFQPARL